MYKHPVNPETQPQLWMFMQYGNGVFFFPYVALLYKRLGMSNAFIGLLLGLRPWLTALFGRLMHTTNLLIIFPNNPREWLGVCRRPHRFPPRNPRNRCGVARVCVLSPCCLSPGVVISSLLRGVTWAYTSLPAQLTLVVLSEFASSPVGLISDAAVMAAGTGVRILEYSLKNYYSALILRCYYLALPSHLVNFHTGG